MTDQAPSLTAGVGRGFAAVDAAERPEPFVDYLRTASGVNAVAEALPRS